MNFEEERQFGAAIAIQPVVPPLIVLGLARSGTTFLYRLLAQDPSFAYPNPGQTLHPHTFLVREGFARGGYAFALRGLNFALSRYAHRGQATADPALALVPAEDERAIEMSGLSTTLMMMLYFPAASEALREFGARTETKEALQRFWLRFLKKLSLRYGAKPLLLKSPAHTGRLALIHQVVPEARYVFIHRHPEDVYRSMTRLWDWVSPLAFQAAPEGWKDMLQKVAPRVISSYLRDRSLIPPGHLHELAYEDLVRDPEAELAKAYRKLSLPNFEIMREPLRMAIAKEAGHKTTPSYELDSSTLAMLRRDWADYYRAFGYQ